MAFEEAVVSFFVDAAGMFGFPKSVAAIYGVCFASPVPLTYSDISGRLMISQGSISTGLNVLREVGALKVECTKQRRDYYSPDMELRRLVSRFIESKLDRQLRAASSHLGEIRELVPDSPDRAELVRRIGVVESWHQQVGALIPLAKHMLKIS